MPKTSLAEAAVWAAIQQWMLGMVGTGTRSRRRSGIRLSRTKRGRWMGSLKVGRLGDLDK